MWAPADMFTRSVSVFTLPAKRLVTFLYEHPVVLAFVFVAAAGLIALSESLSNRRRGGDAEK